jgi:hydrogenase maturation protein HypF
MKAKGLESRFIRVNGIVQGVGFRPFVYNLALENSISGWVRNTGSGVEIYISGKHASINQFIHKLQNDPPGLARIDSLVIEPASLQGGTGFRILDSEMNMQKVMPISPDVSPCKDCLSELFDRQDRRFRYPFNNCTNCGPRYTIIKDIPYDRPNTTMSGFKMCNDCQKEYDDPSDRRFHAQPIACPICGPQVQLVENARTIASGNAAVLLARKKIADGAIVAIKGLGGYLIACDAANDTAIKTLRLRKNRYEKPFALMAFDIDQIKKHALVSGDEVETLSGFERPIVLLRNKTKSSLSSHLAPGQNTLGFMLPNTPLHYLLMEPSPGYPEILVMTSGNRSDEPITYVDDDAFNRLDSIVDCYLTHNRDIHIRVDDSVIRIEDD